MEVARDSASASKANTTTQPDPSSFSWRTIFSITRVRYPDSDDTKGKANALLRMLIPYHLLVPCARQGPAGAATKDDAGEFTRRGREGVHDGIRGSTKLKPKTKKHEEACY